MGMFVGVFFVVFPQVGIEGDVSPFLLQVFLVTDDVFVVVALPEFIALRIV